MHAREAEAPLPFSPVACRLVQFGGTAPIAKYVLSLRRPVAQLIAGGRIAIETGRAQLAGFTSTGVAPHAQERRHQQEGSKGLPSLQG